MEFINLYNYSMLFLLLPLTGLAYVAIKYVRNGASRIVCSLLFVVSVLYMFLVPLEFTSYAKPTTIEWFQRDLKEAEVLWGTIHPDTLDVLVLLWWPGEDTPRLYKVDNFDTEDEKRAFAQELQDAQREAMSGSQPGQNNGEPPSRIMLRYPFLSASERQARIEEDEKTGASGAAEGMASGVEQADDSKTFHTPPPPPIPEKVTQ